MQNKKIPPQFIVRIAVKNDSGAVTGHREFVTYNGLLAVAHDLGLQQINTTVLQMPTDANGRVAVVRAIAQGKPGLFTGIGDASPQNVNRRVALHLLRVAETRAKARALRDFANISMLAIEELGDESDIDLDVVTSPHRREPERRQHEPTGPTMATGNQLRALWRKAVALGHQGNAAREFISERLGCDPTRATREAASKLLDALSAEERVNGADHARA